ncbi:MAG: hypothetical protein ACE5GZ_05190 [Gammaproteobacteria bacterium]
MAFEPTRLDRPLSRFELAVVVSLIGIFITIFIYKILFLTVAAEAQSLELTINRMRARLMIYSAVQLIQHNYENIGKLIDSNPVGIAVDPPKGYIGERVAPAVDEIQAGEWYYDSQTHLLVYNVVNSDYFAATEAGPARVRLRFTLSYIDRNENGIYDKGIDLPQSISLRPVEHYEWRY